MKKNYKKTKSAKKNGAGGFFLGALLGTVAGGIAGLLTAPKSGKETRADLEKQGKKALKAAKNNIDKASKDAQKMFNRKKTETKKAIKSGSQKVK